ncbi:MAG: hypothetical protein HZB67_00230 [Candidatus Aenigmarchaeota archaeon]|nr:hypothetical protein [Candidatus Aenigmarchaeota archaeon]
MKYSGEIRQAAVRANNMFAFGEQATRLLSGAGAHGIMMSIAFAKQMLADTRDASTSICVRTTGVFHRAQMRTIGA